VDGWREERKEGEEGGGMIEGGEVSGGNNDRYITILLAI